MAKSWILVRFHQNTAKLLGISPDYLGFTPCMLWGGLDNMEERREIEDKKDMKAIPPCTCLHHSACDPLCSKKHVLCVPFLHGWWGRCGQQIQAMSKGL